jgi:hypothetical protein
MPWVCNLWTKKYKHNLREYNKLISQKNLLPDIKNYHSNYIELPIIINSNIYKKFKKYLKMDIEKTF